MNFILWVLIDFSFASNMDVGVKMIKSENGNESVGIFFVLIDSAKIIILRRLL